VVELSKLYLNYFLPVGRDIFRFPSFFYFHPIALYQHPTDSFILTLSMREDPLEKIDGSYTSSSIISFYGCWSKLSNSSKPLFFKMPLIVCIFTEFRYLIFEFIPWNTDWYLFPTLYLIIRQTRIYYVIPLFIKSFPL